MSADDFLKSPVLVK
ncbi:hypothetical protein AZE42_14115, partial [Rhizopogon vesiculosus]